MFSSHEPILINLSTCCSNSGDSCPSLSAADLRVFFGRLERFIAEALGANVTPNLFDGVCLGRVWRNVDYRDVATLFKGLSGRRLRLFLFAPFGFILGFVSIVGFFPASRGLSGRPLNPFGFILGFSFIVRFSLASRGAVEQAKPAVAPLNPFGFGSIIGFICLIGFVCGFKGAFRSPP